jgi:hypothetical protein
VVVGDIISLSTDLGVAVSRLETGLVSAILKCLAVGVFSLAAYTCIPVLGDNPL